MNEDHQLTLRLPKGALVGAKLMSITELSEYLGVPETTIYAWNSQGKGPKRLKIGVHVRWRPEDVDAWLATREWVGKHDVDGAA